VPENIDLSNEDAVSRWLANGPSDVAVIFAARAALRVAPLLAGALRSGTVQLGEETVLPAFRSLAVSRAAARYVVEVDSAAALAFDASRRLSDTYDAAEAEVNESHPTPAARPGRRESAAARAATQAAASVADRFTANLEIAALAAVNAAAEAISRGFGSRAAADASAAFLAAADVQIIEDGANASALAACPLWLTEVPAWARDAWQRLEALCWRRTRIGESGQTGIVPVLRARPRIKR
jgi:hypothetical protein